MYENTFNITYLYLLNLCLGILTLKKLITKNSLADNLIGMSV